MNSNNNKVVLMSSKELKNEIQNMLIEQKMRYLKSYQKLKKQLFTRTELSKYLKVSQQTIINWSARGILNPRFIGSRGYYKGDEVRILLYQ